MIKYRIASIDDIEVLIDTRIKFLHEAEEIHINECSKNLRETLRTYFQNNVPKGNFISWVAYEEDNIVATSGVSFHEVPPTFGNVSGKEAYIMNMYTLPEYRKRGIGTRLITKLLEIIKERGIKKVRLHATDKGKSLYERAGFQNKDDEMVLILE